MPRPLRLAYGRIFHEANAYSPLSTTLESFEAFHLHRGEAVADLTAPHRFELEGFLRNAELSGFVHACRLAGGVTTVPLLSALAVPCGKLTAEAFAALRDELAERIRAAGPLDAVYLALHGSMRVEGMAGPPEAELLAAAHEASGGVPLAVSYDLHANLTRPIVEPATVLQLYRANPHWDLWPTGFRTARSLIATLRGEARPVHTWRKLPIVLGGGVGVTFLSPMRQVYRRLAGHARRRGVMNASLAMVHPYSDADDLGWAVHVTTDGDLALADRIADDLADRAWAVRDAPIPDRLDLDEALDQVRSRGRFERLGPVCLVDFDDVVGTGASGGNTRLLARLVAHPPGLRVYLPIHDPAGVDALWDRVGERASITLRGTPGMTQPEVPVTGEVLARRDGDFGRVVALDTGDTAIAVSERPPYSVHPRYWRELSLEPRGADVLVQKSFFHYRIFHATTSAMHLPVVSAGPSSLDRITERRFPRPVHPNDPVDGWRDFDRAMR